MLNINSPVVVNGQHHTVMSVRNITDLIRQNCGDDLASLVETFSQNKLQSLPSGKSLMKWILSWRM